MFQGNTVLPTILFCFVVSTLQDSSEDIKNLLNSAKPTTGLKNASRATSGAMLCPIGKDGFSYKWISTRGPSSWSSISPCCGGSRQSPRNLGTDRGASTCLRTGTGRFRYNTSRVLEGHLYNNGNDPTIHFTAPDTAYLIGAPYTDGPYVLYNIHIHFNSLLGRGSEHAIDGYFYDGEVHLVHYKAEYGSVQEAVLHDDGLVVIAVLLQEVFDDTENDEICGLINKLVMLEGVGVDYRLPHLVNLTRLVNDTTEYYTYAGSLTQPSCSEAVRWIVLKKPAPVHFLQLAILTSLRSGEGGYIADSSNDRPLQNGNTTIERNFACP
ncbi:Phospholipase A2 crotoxin acid subunit CA [Bulinus truncatus]|nr:Phospholipase A2 crotoxin acid subunit CA [Bulinus truncatus]